MEKNNGERNRQLVLMQSFWELQKSIMTQVKQTAADNDLSVPQFGILTMMQQNERIAQKKLQERTHYPKSTLSYAIEGLVQAGLLKRTQMEGNRREMDLILSTEGKSLFEQIKSQEDAIHRRFKNAVDSFTEDEFSDLIQMHQQIVTYFEGSETD